MKFFTLYFSFLYFAIGVVASCSSDYDCTCNCDSTAAHVFCNDCNPCNDKLRPNCKDGTYDYSAVAPMFKIKDHVWTKIGEVRMTQQRGCSVSVNGSLKMTPEDLPTMKGQKGLHIHTSAVFGEDCLSAGPHFKTAPGITHGDRNDVSSHAGDAGNIYCSEDGCFFYFHLKYVELACGPYSIIGRSLVLHVAPDDLGKGGTDLSLATGSSGARYACGTIGRVE